MTKSGAIIAMSYGKKVTHRYFSSNEWMTLENGNFVFEDGVKVSPREFWNDRSDKQWDDDWDIFKGNSN